MKKLKIFLKKSGVSMVNNGIVKDFNYEYDPSMTMMSLVDLCQKIYKDIKEFVKNSTDEKFEILFNYPASSDINICHFVAGWLNGTDEVNSETLATVVLVERISNA